MLIWLAYNVQSGFNMSTEIETAGGGGGGGRERERERKGERECEWRGRGQLRDHNLIMHVYRVSGVPHMNRKENQPTMLGWQSSRLFHF